MSEVSGTATVRILIADYVSADAVGKLNLIGGGVSVLGVQGAELGASEGNTAPFGLVISVAVVPAFYGAECSVELVLEDSTQSVVSVPTPDGKGRQPMRIAQNVVFEEPSFPSGSRVPRNILPSRIQWVLMFPGGLTLTPSSLFYWRVRIDNQTRDDWAEPFYIPSAPDPLVVG